MKHWKYFEIYYLDRNNCFWIFYYLFRALLQKNHSSKCLDTFCKASIFNWSDHFSSMLIYMISLLLDSHSFCILNCIHRYSPRIFSLLDHFWTSVIEKAHLFSSLAIRYSRNSICRRLLLKKVYLHLKCRNSFDCSSFILLNPSFS